MALCRNTACGCEAEQGPYCKMCAEYTPICPVCSSVYGEHGLDCTVADGYLDCLEGPWATEQQALDFARAEVGRPWDVVCGMGQWYVLFKEEE